MILSFHPLFEADKNIICAGRKPDANDLSAINAADAIILPQGCYKSLFEMARDNCPNVFPDYEARFKFPGKIGQIRLFQKEKAAYPRSNICLNVGDFLNKSNKLPGKLPFDFPFVFKFDWGGEGETVYLIKSAAQLQEIIQKANMFERTGQPGFIIQEYIPSQNRSLRVVVIGKEVISYWRFQDDLQSFHTSIAKGASIDTDSDPDLQEMAVKSVKIFCQKTGINLAGFDLLFSTEQETAKPLFLEINYFFGRRGLGGSEKYYQLLEAEIHRWIKNIGLSLTN